MRNKIKQLLKKEGGFTLVELLAVIVILGIILGISIPMVGSVISDSKKTTEGQQDELVINAAQLYFIQNDEADEVTPGKLVSDDFLIELPESGAYTKTDEVIKRDDALKGAAATSSSAGE